MNHTSIRKITVLSLYGWWSCDWQSTIALFYDHIVTLLLYYQGPEDSQPQQSKSMRSDIHGMSYMGGDSQSRLSEDSNSSQGDSSLSRPPPPLGLYIHLLTWAFTVSVLGMSYMHMGGDKWEYTKRRLKTCHRDIHPCGDQLQAWVCIFASSCVVTVFALGMSYVGGDRVHQSDGCIMDMTFVDSNPTGGRILSRGEAFQLVCRMLVNCCGYRICPKTKTWVTITHSWPRSIFEFISLLV